MKMQRTVGEAPMTYEQDEETQFVCFCGEVSSGGWIVIKGQGWKCEHGNPIIISEGEK